MKHSSSSTSSSSASDVKQSNNEAVSIIVQYLKAQGIFDHFRRECLEDVDTKPSFSNLRQRLEGYVNRFLSQQEWSQSVNKNQLRERLRKQINESGMVKYNVDHLVDQVVTTRASTYVYPRIERVVKEYLGLTEDEEEIKKEKNDKSENVWSENVNICKNETGSQNKVKKEDEYHNPPSLSPSLVSSESLSTPSPSSESNHSNHSFKSSSHSADNVPKSGFKSTFTEISFDQKDSNESVVLSVQDSKLPQTKFETSLPESDSSTSLSYSSHTLLSNVSIKSTLKPAISTSIKTSQTVSTKSSNQSYTSHSKPLSPKLQTASILSSLIPQSQPVSLSTIPSSSTSFSLVNNQEPTSLETDHSKLENDYLSDVSSVHTSDLSDFDDRISISSGEEEKGLKKKKVSLKELKKMIQNEMKSKDKSTPKSLASSRNGKNKDKKK